ncbi:MAG: hypothetical protein ACRDWI_05725 [Jiangellaceae bacterium]
MATAPVDQQWLRERLTLSEFPRSATYEPQWMIDNCMGPNPLWLLESLSAHVPSSRACGFSTSAAAGR